MNKSTVEMACKWASIVLVIASIIMMFTGWMSVNKRYKDRFVDALRDAKKSFNIDKDDIEEAEEQLEDLGVDINLKKIVKQTKGIWNALKDASISPSDVAFTGPTILDITKTLEDVEDEMPSYLLTNDWDEFMDMIDQIKGGIIALIILFYLTIVVDVVVVILHIRNKAQVGITPIVLNLIWWITMGVTTHKINMYAEDEIGRTVVELTASPFWAMLFAVAAAAIWMFRDKIVAFSMSKIGVSGVNIPISTAEVSGGKKCPTCGKILKDDAVFCPGCGNRFEEIEKKTQIYSINSTTEIEDKKEGEGKALCSNCGAELAAEAVFCPKCGAKR